MDNIGRTHMKDWKTICSVIFAMNLKSAILQISVTYVQHIGIWPHNISVTVM